MISMHRQPVDDALGDPRVDTLNKLGPRHGLIAVQIDEFAAHPVVVRVMPQMLKLPPRFSHPDCPFAWPFAASVGVERILQGSNGLLSVGVDSVADESLEVEIQDVGVLRSEER